MDSDQLDPHRQRDHSKGSLISRKKARIKRRQEQLVQQLENKRLCQEQESGVQTECKASAACRTFTVTVALPGSVLDNAQSAELRTYLAGQIARALAVFRVDEVVVFDDQQRPPSAGDVPVPTVEGEFSGLSQQGQGCVQLARLLQYLECPQYLRKSFFPLHKDLKYAGLLNPTDMPHHLRASEWSKYREGVVVEQRPASKTGSSVYIGLSQKCIVDKELSVGVRVTVQLPEQRPESRVIRGCVVSPSQPRTKDGLFWGYTVRLASSLSAVFTESKFKAGYDFTVGTSERGSSVDQCNWNGQSFKHLLIVFGGVCGLEAALQADNHLSSDVSDPADLFDVYLNTCPGQGSRTIRTEEALLISLAALRPGIGF